MSFNKTNALLAVLQVALVEARNIGYNIRDGRGDPQQLIDLTDATHNIPIWLLDPSTIDEGKVLFSLRSYQERWGKHCYRSLVDVYVETPPDTGNPRTIADEVRDFHRTPDSAKDLIRRLTMKLMDIRCPSCGAGVPVELQT